MGKNDLQKLKRLIEDEVSFRYSTGDVLKSTIRDAKEVRSEALERMRLSLEESFSSGILRKLAQLERNSGAIGKSGDIGICGTQGKSGDMGVCGTAGKSFEFGSAGTSRIFEIPQHEIEQINEVYEENDYSFYHLQDSEFKESVKKLYENYKI